MLIELQFDFLQLVLKTLLQDKNTGKNIIWATDDYKKYGPEYFSDCEMTSYNVNALDINVLQPRVTQSKEAQKGRTKGKAEVFTPSWLCENMNTYCDLDWFNTRKKDKAGKVKFIFDEKKSLKSYVDLKKLEITCGEAPFVVSRYDTTKGNLIPLYKRIGFLDRKLMAISQYIEDKEKWLEMIYRSYENSYGYEYQGDNLLKARINLFYTFIDYYEKKWNMFPSNAELKKIANIISRNFWQMDGLSYTVPNTDIECKVYNWRSKKNMKLLGDGSMKFDFVVGNPPYQEKDGGAQSSAIPIYNKFIDESKKISDKMILVVPARWMTCGKGLDDFRKEMINDKSIKVLYDFANSKDVFSGVDIKGGVCYFYRDSKYNGKCQCYRQTSDGVSNSFRYLCEDGDDIFIRENILITIKEKVISVSNNFVSSIVSARKPYGLAGDTMQDAGKYGLPEFSDSFIEDGYSIYGLERSQRRTWKYISKDYPLPKTFGIDKYKVFVSRAYGCGNIGEIPSTPVLGTPGQLCTETFLQIGPFDTKIEGDNFLKYLRSKFFRCLVGIKKQTQDASSKVYQFVPMQNFLDNSDIDWSKSINEIDQQLYIKYGLEEKEIQFIETKIKELG